MAEQTPVFAHNIIFKPSAYKYPNIIGLYARGVFQLEKTYKPANFTFARSSFNRSGAYEYPNILGVWAKTGFQLEKSYKPANFTFARSNFHKYNAMQSFMINKNNLNVLKWKQSIKMAKTKPYKEQAYGHLNSTSSGDWSYTKFIKMMGTHVIAYRQMTTSAQAVQGPTSSQFQA